jgi:ferric-dicitrate binding protein FerR (iron transport regulator)
MLDRGSATLAIALVSLIASIGAASNRLAIGSITAINGSATLTRNGVAKQVYYGDLVQTGDLLATSSNARVTMTLTDKSQMELTGSTKVLLDTPSPSFGGSHAITKVTLIDGTVDSIVRAEPGMPPGFEVSTSNAIAKAGAGSFKVDYQHGESRKGYRDCREFTDVSVYSGTAEVSSLGNPSGMPVRVQKNQKTIVPCGLAVTSAASMTSVGLSPMAMTAIGASGLGGIGGILAGILSGGGSSGGSSGFVPVTRFPASASR